MTLNKSEQTTLIKLLAESTSSALLCLDQEFNIIFLNKGYADIFDKKVAYFKGNNFFELIPNNLLKGILENVINKEEEFVLEAQPFQFTDAPSQIKLWDWHVKPFQERNKKYILIQLKDVSHQIRSKEKEIEQEERYKKLFERSLSGLYQRTIDGKILNCNNAYAQILGYSDKDDVIGKNIHDLINLNKSELVKVWSNLVNDRLETTESTFKLKNGNKKWILESGLLIQGNNFKESQIEGSMIDITPMKKASLELKKKQTEVIELQMQMLSSQMNPHFIFNAINSISGYIADEDIENAMIYTVEFADLMRDVLENSQGKGISISEEITFLKKYSDLEKKRIQTSFEVNFEIDNRLNLEKLKIPAMIIQPFLENAIIHGLPDKAKGIIRLKFEKLSNKSLFCEISDNGKGFSDQSEKNGDHKSLGIKITNNRLDLFNKKKRKYRVEKSNLKDENGNIKGANISLYIPIL